MKLIRDLWMIVIGLYHMIAGDIRDWRNRKSVELKEAICPPIENHDIKPEPIWGKPHDPKPAAKIHKVDLESFRNPNPPAFDWHELERKNHEKMIERHRQIVLKALNQN